jgi:hypothetical protein
MNSVLLKSYSTIQRCIKVNRSNPLCSTQVCTRLFHSHSAYIKWNIPIDIDSRKRRWVVVQCLFRLYISESSKSSDSAPRWSRNCSSHHRVSCGWEFPITFTLCISWRLSNHALGIYSGKQKWNSNSEDHIYFYANHRERPPISSA